MKIRTWTQNTNLQTSSVLQFNGFSNPAQIQPKCCPNTALCCLNAAQVLPKCCPNPAQMLPETCPALLNTAQAEIDKQKPSSASEKQPFQEHHLRYVQFFYINWKYLRGIVRISSCLRSGNFTSRQKFWPRFSVLFRKWAKWHKFKLSSASVKLLFLDNERTLNREIEPRKTIWEVLSEHASRFDEA